VAIRVVKTRQFSQLSKRGSFGWLLVWLKRGIFGWLLVWLKRGVLGGYQCG